MKSLNEDRLRDEIVALDETARDREFSPDERRSWNEANERLDEHRKRRARVAELAGRPGAVICGVSALAARPFRARL